MKLLIPIAVRVREAERMIFGLQRFPLCREGQEFRIGRSFFRRNGSGLGQRGEARAGQQSPACDGQSSGILGTSHGSKLLDSLGCGQAG